MMLVAPGYQLLSTGQLAPVGGGCVHVSGGQLLSDGRIRWDHEALTFGNAQERKT